MSSRTDLKDGVFINVAFEIAQLGTCDRAHVGAVLVKEGRCISWGYNGAPPGMTHCEKNFHGWIDKIPLYLDQRMAQTEREWLVNQVRTHGCINATHAEANVLASSARQGISTFACTLYVTHAPCVVCARSLVAAGIDRVVYVNTYRNDDGLRLLGAAHIEVHGFVP